MAGELREVMILAPRAKNGAAVGEYREIALAIGREIEASADRGLVQHQFDAGQGPRKGYHLRDVARLAQVHPDERSQGAVMADEWIGDRTNHPDRVFAEACRDLV